MLSVVVTRFNLDKTRNQNGDHYFSSPTVDLPSQGDISNLVASQNSNITTDARRLSGRISKHKIS